MRSTRDPHSEVAKDGFPVQARIDRSHEAQVKLRKCLRREAKLQTEEMTWVKAQEQE